MFRSQNGKSEYENGTAEDKQKQKVKEQIAVYGTNKLSTDANARERYQQEIVEFIHENQPDTSKSWDLKLMRNGPVYSKVWQKHPRKMMGHVKTAKTLRWRHNGRDGVSNHQPHDCLLNSLFGSRSKKTSKFRVTGLCVGNSPGTGEFPAQMASYAENVFIWWRHHDTYNV